MSCLVCGYSHTVPAHFPHAVGMGRNRKKDDGPTVPLCRSCHSLQHMGSEEVVDALIELAPEHWHAEYERALQELETFRQRREYVQATW